MKTSHLVARVGAGRVSGRSRLGLRVDRLRLLLSLVVAPPLLACEDDPNDTAGAMTPGKVPAIVVGQEEEPPIGAAVPGSSPGAGAGGMAVAGMMSPTGGMGAAATGGAAAGGTGGAPDNDADAGM